MENSRVIGDGVAIYPIILVAATDTGTTNNCGSGQAGLSILDMFSLRYHYLASGLKYNCSERERTNIFIFAPDCHLFTFSRYDISEQ